MKPNFALNLSHEGISLLHRAKTGWLRVGDVALDAKDLETQLNMLRRTASDLETGGLTTKLVIPNSQILYTEVDAPGPDTAARISQIRDGLVGLTPYDVADLVFDWRMKGKRAHVAVVSRDTLREAESFATEYRFNPISFVAVPVNGSFDGEPYFGPTRHASELLVDGEAIEPDSQRINVLGPADAASGAAKQKPTPPGKAPAPKPDPDPTPASAETPADPKPKAEPALLVLAEPAPPPDPELALPAVTFASRRKQVASPAARPGSMHSEPRISFSADTDKTPPAASAPQLIPEAAKPPRTNGAARDTPAFDIPGQSRPGDGPALYSTPKSAAPAGDKARPAVAKPAPAKIVHRQPEPKPGAIKTPMPVTAPHTPDAVDTRDKATEKRRLASQKAMKAGAAVIGSIGKLARSTPDVARRNPKPATPPKSAATEAASMTVFGARGRATQRGKPKYLGLVLTLVLLIALAVLALWSTYFMNDVTSGLFGAVDEEPEIAAPAVIPQPDPAPAAETAALRETPIAEPVPETPQTPIEAAIETALADLETPLPEVTEEVPAEPAPEELALLTEADVPVEVPAIAALPEPEPEQPVVPDPIVSVPERQPPPTPAEADARYAATGIWQLDPEPLVDVPGGGDQLDDLYIASIDPEIGAPDAVALPNSGSLDTDRQAQAPNPPAPLGTKFDFDERGLIRATPGGALSPDGVPVFSGAPAVVPGPRPADLEVPVDETRLLLDEKLRAFRPVPRPGGLSESNERARLGGLSSVELAAIRPSARPLSIQEARETVFDTEREETRTAAIDPVFVGEDVTALAVVASRPPPVRPSNFAGVVERALEEATRAPPDPLPEKENKPEVLVATAAARMPPVPSRASVAKQATVRNAISLGKVNLIGVYGSPSKRRALVRLSSGKYVKVEVGDRVDGGRVAAIGNTELRYVKRGKNITLKMPKG